MILSSCTSFVYFQKVVMFGNKFLINKTGIRRPKIKFPNYCGTIMTRNETFSNKDYSCNKFSSNKTDFIRPKITFLNYCGMAMTRKEIS